MLLCIQGLKIRKFKKGDERKLSYLIRKCIVTINSKDISKEEAKILYDYFAPANILSDSLRFDIYVAEYNDNIVGTATLNDNCIKAVFVNTSFHKKGIGTKLMKRLESILKRRGFHNVYLNSSPFAVDFYTKLGYDKVKDVDGDVGRMTLMTKSFKNIEIESVRLKLIPVSINYSKEIFREFTPEITTFMYPKAAENIFETETFIKESIENMEKEEELVFVILNKDTKEYLGNCGIHKINTKIPELGIWIKKGAHGNAYGKEAIKALKNWIDENLDYEYALYPVDKNNIASRRIPEMFGAKVFREYQLNTPDGRLLNIVEYRIYKK